MISASVVVSGSDLMPNTVSWDASGSADWVAFRQRLRLVGLSSSFESVGVVTSDLTIRSGSCWLPQGLDIVSGDSLAILGGDSIVKSDS